MLLDKFGSESALPIERVVVFGRPTLSRQISTLLARTDLERALFVPAPVPWFEPGRRTELILTQWDQLLGFAGRGPEGWLQAWQQAGEQAELALDSELAGTSKETGGRPGAENSPPQAPSMDCSLPEQSGTRPRRTPAASSCLVPPTRSVTLTSLASPQ
ncbi:hypothetical protein NHF46_19605 [Arthrobacter alpinus]|nr:hypothetical protein [Arthrobacter alpinus]